MFHETDRQMVEADAATSAMIFHEFKEWNVRVLWFHDAGEPAVRRRIICTQVCPKLNKKKFQQEKKKAVRMRTRYLAAKKEGTLKEYILGEPARVKP